MLVLTSIFVADPKARSQSGAAESIEWDLTIAETGKVLEESGRELISMYEGKNRVEPLE